MTVPNNLTLLGNQTDIAGIITQLDALTEGVLGLGIVTLIFLVFMFSYKGFDGKSAFAAASFVSAGFAIFFFLFGFLSSFWVTVFILIAAAAAAFLFYNSS